MRQVLAIAGAAALAMSVSISAQDTTKPAAAEHTMTGCLAKGATADTFIVNSTAEKGPKTIGIVSSAAPLAGHVGHKIDITGTNVPAADFIGLMAHAACLVGNSSAGIKECSFLGTPVVNIGNRQQGRLSGEHVTHVGYNAADIAAAIASQLAHGRYESSEIYHRDNASDTIVDLLVTSPLYTQKRFHDRQA